MMMICSAPRRFAAMTPHSPTAPSPTTASESPGLTPATTAAWWPVASTSESVSSDAMSSWSSPTGSAYSVPSAMGTQRLGLRAVVAEVADEADVDTGGVQPLLAEIAGAVREGERHHDQIAALDGPHVGADVVDDTDGLVTHRLAALARRHLARSRGLSR